MRNSLLFVALALAASVPAHAVESYVGFGISQAPDGDLRGFSGDVDTDPFGKIYGGVYLNDNFSIEGAYHDFGTAKFDGIGDFGFDLDAHAWSLGVRYEYGDAAWAPYTKIGFFDATTKGELITIAGTQRINESENGLLIEGGVRYTPNDTFSIRGGYEWFDFDGGSNEGLTIAAEFSFWISRPIAVARSETG